MLHSCEGSGVKNKGLSIRGMVYASIFGAVTAAGAYIMIPLPPVPITLQTLFLYVAAALLGGRLGALSQVVYLLVGLIGLPVFAGGKAGMGVLLGPTGGYLIGFIAGAYVIGKLVETKRTPGLIWIVFSMVSGTALIYLFGVFQLMIIANLSMNKAITVGVLPFLIGDALKIVVAAFLTLKVRDRIRI
ncbi:MAG: biotin transporter BioY [Desulfobacteraceae bacterium]|nr:biotin transporter BioY [Desulfobacterales bacterium]MBL6967973.1 biotin transporter BioY [Desulfobacteraceae bacterium]MBL7101852.1 biotin transporter BioY [Desulfobacteraceae bacterium]MBL7173953.1 biotin transporter BioY [Desulfobacteraceae bacterium]MBU0733180.1 biotin transporter BioY [Pseudomonadota bacterium]